MELWDLDAGRPMVETIYHSTNESASDDDADIHPFLWIVEPAENGNLYILAPGPQPSLQNLRLTVKQLAEELSPYSSANPPAVYTAEKKSTLYVVEASSGRILKQFSSAGSSIVDAQSCEPRATGFAGSSQLQCRGTFLLGQTEYTIRVQSLKTAETICTIKYFEWTPNGRDRDLHTQYQSTMDNKYVYSKFDGEIIGIDHTGDKNLKLKRPMYKKKLSSPVARVFDVARPFDSDDPEAPLVILPQPAGPAKEEEGLHDVWLNTTNSGSWYALSEREYPAVTDGAEEARCYKLDYDLMTYNGEHLLPDRHSLVGVHSLDRNPPNLPLAIAGPIAEQPSIASPSPSAVAKDDGKPVINPTTGSTWWAFLVTLLVISAGLGSWLRKPSTFEFVRKKVLVHLPQVETAKVAPPLPAQPETEAVKAEAPPISAPVVTEAPENTEVAPPEIKEQRRVKFDIPDDEDEDELEPLSRATTIEEVPGDREDAAGNPKSAEIGENDAQDAAASTPVKKKKTHRGKRGSGRKKREQRETDEVSKIVNAAKELDQSPSLHPDELTMTGDDVQDVTNVKRIGKLTIDFDHVLGNGSGGTFVFEGKWNERDVAVKRMLPQYFGLAEQEVKLLQESDLHPNVIRYFDDEKDENFLYIAVELCQASLWDLYRDGRIGEELSENQQRLVNEINCDMPRALYQLALGVNHLHSLRIIHRDIKPQNILIAYPARNQKNGPRLVISDFGLCKTLPDNVSTLIGTTGNAGTVGWKAPELILQPKETERNSSTGHSRDSSSSTDPVAQGVKRAVDIFSLGCVFYYVLTNGSHPFDDDEGWMQIRELNIKKNKANYSKLSIGDDSEEPIHLISWMLSNRPEDRPTALQVIHHPFFWPAEKRLNFLCDCSDHWEREPRDPPSAHLSVLEKYSYDVLDKKRNFLAKLDHGFINSLGKQRKYTGDRMLDLLRALRNKKNHYEDMEESVKAKVGPLPHGYLRYWTTKFPKLVMACYECVVECGLQDEPRFRPYFQTQAGP